MQTCSNMEYCRIVISQDKICWLVITSPSIHLSAVYIVCLPKTNLIASQHPISVCQTFHHPPIFLSFHPSLALLTVPSAPSFCPSVLSVQLSVLPWLCWQLLGLMPSQCSAPSWPLERRLHSLSRWTGNRSFSHCFFLKFSLPSKVYFTLFP